MFDDLVTRALAATRPEFEPLSREAREQGFHAIERLIDDWRSGLNRFDSTGEALIGVWRGGRLLGVGGLNVDPFASRAEVGRLRRVYVLMEARRSGVGAALVNHLLRNASHTFSEVRVRTDSASAAMFYVSLGFSRVDDGDATHAIRV